MSEKQQGTDTEDEEIYETSKKIMQDSYTAGTPGKGGSLKVYFDMSNLKDTQIRLENYIKVKEWLKLKGIEIQ